MSKNEKVGQEQIHGLLFGDKLSWQAIIYDLINTEQLDPWDVDICLLSNKYLERVRKLEEANFFVSSKVLLAASLLLRIKSEILLNHYIPGLDDILFGKQEEKKYVQEKIEFDDDVPELIPRTPIPRGRKVSLQELMSALGKAIKTETRRIKRVVVDKQREFDTMGVIPRGVIDLREQIGVFFRKLKDYFSSSKEERVAFSNFAGKNAEEKISLFLPLLHLDNQHKILAEQDAHFEEIWIWLKHVYDKRHANVLEEMRKEAEESLKSDLIEEAKESELEKVDMAEKKGRKIKKNFGGKEDEKAEGR